MKHFRNLVASRFIYNSCLRKVVFLSKKRAKAQLKNSQIKASKRLYIYECSLCGGWHLTKKERGDEHRSK